MLLVAHSFHEQAITKLAFAPHTPSLMLTSSLDGNVCIWDREHRELARYQHCTQAITACWSPDGSLVASSARLDEALHLWNPHTRQAGLRVPLTLNATNQLEILALAWSPDGRLLAAGCNDGTVQLIDIAQGIHICTYRISAQAYHRVNALAWSPDGALLATGGDGYRAGVFLWNVVGDLRTSASPGKATEVSTGAALQSAELAAVPA
jgi:WD40 repeat protein